MCLICKLIETVEDKEYKLIDRDFYSLSLEYNISKTKPLPSNDTLIRQKTLRLIKTTHV